MKMRILQAALNAIRTAAEQAATEERTGLTVGDSEEEEGGTPMRAMKMKILPSALHCIRTAAERAAPNECMGLLVGDRGELVTGAVLLQGEAGNAYAAASPEVLHEAADLLRAQAWRPLGLWHSHVDFAVFHSGTDEETVNRLLPGLALWSSSPWPTPSAGIRSLAPDAVEVGSTDGEVQSIRLLGPAVPGTDGRERAVWSHVRVGNDGDASREARIEMIGGELVVDCGTTRLWLGIPEEASVLVSRGEAPLARRADLFSLVVNLRSDLYCERVTVLSSEEERFVVRAACDVDVVAEDEPRRERAVLLQAARPRQTTAGKPVDTGDVRVAVR